MEWLTYSNSRFKTCRVAANENNTLVITIAVPASPTDLGSIISLPLHKFPCGRVIDAEYSPQVKDSIWLGMPLISKKVLEELLFCLFRHGDLTLLVWGDNFQSLGISRGQLLTFGVFFYTLPPLTSLLPSFPSKVPCGIHILKACYSTFNCPCSFWANETVYGSF